MEAPDGTSLVQVNPVSFSTPLPHKLANGAQASWFMRWDALDKQRAELDVGRRTAGKRDHPVRS